MRAALPYVTDFVAGHSLAAFEHLAEVLARGASPAAANAAKFGPVERPAHA
jgi:hypothetical protein